MIDAASVFLEKAIESLAGAESELANGRYDNCAHRCYYACFQAAIAAFQRAGVHARGGQWGHEFVQAEFVRQREATERAIAEETEPRTRR
jgi:uncharacterized protein (UPF0332 family)